MAYNLRFPQLWFRTCPENGRQYETSQITSSINSVIIVDSMPSFENLITI